MKNTLRQYVQLRDALRREKQQLEVRLLEINEALGEEEAAAPAISRTTATAAPVSQASTASRKGGRGRRGGGSGGRSLRDIVMEVTSRRPMTKNEILDEVQRLGYTFNSKNPANSLGVILYGKNPRFANEDGRFSLRGGGGGSQSSSSGSNSGGGGKRKRRMSEEGRERIRAAARARWQKVKASGKNRL